MRHTRLFIGLLLCGLSLPFAAPSANAVQAWPTKEAKRIEAALADLGLPVGPVDGVWDEETARATCAWRELTGREVVRSWPLVTERRAVRTTAQLTVASYMKRGININRQCQVAYWVVPGRIAQTETRTVTTQPTGDTPTGLAQETVTVTVSRPGPVVKRVMPVSTGMTTPSGRLETHPGTFRVNWAVDRWWQSTIYPDGKMYRPFFFDGGQALHGSASDALVHTYPASHGCVRMLHADIDALWDSDFGPGDTVRVYGDWQD